MMGVFSKPRTFMKIDLLSYCRIYIGLDDEVTAYRSLGKYRSDDKLSIFEAVQKHPRFRHAFAHPPFHDQRSLLTSTTTEIPPVFHCRTLTNHKLYKMPLPKIYSRLAGFNRQPAASESQ
jgi:hypothetical protein